MPRDKIEATLHFGDGQLIFTAEERRDYITLVTTDYYHQKEVTVSIPRDKLEALAEFLRVLI